MKRTAFTRRPAPAAATSREERLQARAARVMAEARPRASVVAACSSAPAIQKVAPVRSPSYRRIVAALPCVICGVAGYSQAAHGTDGKGMGLKATDLCLFPACCSRPGVVGCHARLDQGAMFTKEERRALEPGWVRRTQMLVHGLGLWPVSLSFPPAAFAA